ncbi:isoaspartyl dipeptidase [Planctomycetes bacterium CA13]|uniref:Isoaspartyl dipeptidase n=1 Tax=Novipirellula herctigrandis TaxID=2527986 RepID=A0A5C5Z6K0_9BACT|nr:isoaspartyl dipeptidase [Planctomycetes bacterium CA13]
MKPTLWFAVAWITGFAIPGSAIQIVHAQRSTITQQSTTTRPIVGLRKADPSPVLLVGADVVCDPDSPSKPASILMHGATIVAVGNNIQVPAGTETRTLSGKRIYPGLIDAMHDVELPENLPTDKTGYWNKNVSPEFRAAWATTSNENERKKLHSQGITAQLRAPKDGIIKGASCVVLALTPDHPQYLLQRDVFQHLALTVPRGKRRDTYPNSPMGAVALVRQAFYDAIWYDKANRVYQNNQTVPRPRPNLSLEELSQTLHSGTFVVDAPNERFAIRAGNLADEFSIDMILRGSGFEYCELPAITRQGHLVLLPVDFPDTPDTTTLESIRETPLREWLHWYFAPENPARLHREGVRFCLTTDGLDDTSSFLKHVRIAVDRGLDSRVALAALTTVPAELLGVEKRTGKIQPGMMANLVVADGDLFAKETTVTETWVAGERFEIEKEKPLADDPLIGSWKVTLPGSKQRISAVLVFEKKDDKTTGSIRCTKSQSTDEDPNAQQREEKPEETRVELKNNVRQREKLSTSVQLSKLSDAFPEGVSQLTLLIVSNVDHSKESPLVLATLTTPDGKSQSVPIRRVKRQDKPEQEVSPTPTAKETSDSNVESSERKPIEMVYPLGAYGLAQRPTKPNAVLFRGATVWTSGPKAKIDDADVLVIDGKIAEVGKKLVAPKKCVTIDARGKHLTPGLIDCHSHIATDGGINESGQAITSEVRIADFIDNSDISIYRQLAGGVTASNILHGSANPIGGQNQVIKMRWGGSMEDLKFADAPAGIKFALGENVKRSSGRYPNTRMGVEQIIRDQFLAARQYDADHKAWQDGARDRLPPRRNLQLDALVEIQTGDRWIHCHSYRQDEILATLDVLEEFNIRIGTLQHILEGYKVADRMASHGAMASTFADWWAYKFEVYDAIPYNGVLMHDAGVVVSYNSDDAELGRHLNAEAGKAIKYGGVPEQDALAFVTLNPAKQLRIDDHVGSIEVGKDADLAVWSGPPLSPTSRCEQTWIDGQKYFDLKTDRMLRARDKSLRARLVQLALETDNQPKSDKTKDEEEVKEADRWERIDVYCNAGRSQGESR